MFADLIINAQLFFLVAVRILAIVETAPIMSSDAIPQVAKVALAGFCAFAVFPAVLAAGYAIPADGLAYALLVAGEAIIGIIIGFFLTIITTAFGMAGQLFSLQMGFGASETFDPLAQIEIPIVGQFLNLVSMLVLLCTGGMQKIFLVAMQGSFKAIMAIDLVTRRDQIIDTLLQGMGGLFLQALALAFPIVGSLFLISVTTGLLSRAAPQMNLLTEGFPISISVAFLVIFSALPFMVEAFARILDSGYLRLAELFGTGLPCARP